MSSKKKDQSSIAEELRRAAEEAGEKMLEELEPVTAKLQKAILAKLEEEEKLEVKVLAPKITHPTLPKGALSAMDRKRLRKLGPIKIELTLELTTKKK